MEEKYTIKEDCLDDVVIKDDCLDDVVIKEEFLGGLTIKAEPLEETTIKEEPLEDLMIKEEPLHDLAIKDKSLEALVMEATNLMSEDEKSLTCRYCGRTFKYFSHLKRHLWPDKKTPKRNRCKNLYATICNADDDEHDRSNQNDFEYYDDSPNESDTSEYTAEGEIDEEINDEFLIASEEKTHYIKKKRTENGKPTQKGGKFNCRFCKKSLATKYTLTQHLKIHIGDRPHVCNGCSKSFTTLRTLKKHLRYHKLDKDYLCDVCQKSFVTQGRLDEHYRTHTGEKPFECHECDKAFSHRSSLRDHRRLHTGEKPYICKLCDSTFVTVSRLNEHHRIHTGELYVCEVCEKGFMNRTALKMHLVIHTGERPYSCHLCKQTYNVPGNLRKHLKSVHGKTVKVESITDAPCNTHR